MKEILDMLETIRRVTMENNAFLKTLDLRGRTNEDRRLEKEVVENTFPLKTVEELQSYETKLADSKEYQKLKKHFEQIGGPDPKKYVERVLKITFHDDLAKQCSWYGKRGNNAVMGLNITKAIKEVTTESYKDVQHYRIEKTMAEWFRLAGTRLGRFKKTAVNESQNKEN